MKIRLIKPHKLHSLGKQLPIGKEFDVITCKGEELISKGIAESLEDYPVKKEKKKPSKNEAKKEVILPIEEKEEITDKNNIKNK